MEEKNSFKLLFIFIGRMKFISRQNDLKHLVTSQSSSREARATVCTLKPICLHLYTVQSPAHEGVLLPQWSRWSSTYLPPHWPTWSRHSLIETPFLDISWLCQVGKGSAQNLHNSKPIKISTWREALTQSHPWRRSSWSHWVSIGPSFSRWLYTHAIALIAIRGSFKKEIKLGGRHC